MSERYTFANLAHGIIVRMESNVCYLEYFERIGNLEFCSGQQTVQEDNVFGVLVYVVFLIITIRSGRRA